MPLLRAALLLVLAVGALRAESWNNPRDNLPKNVQHRTFTSASMKTEVGYNIYLPEDYAKDPTHAYPVLYYLHGRGGNENDNMGSFGLFDAAIQAGKIPPFIYVHAMCGSQSGYVDAPDGSVMGETVFIKELIPHIDATYRTLPFKGARAIEGFSKGGQGALLFAYKFPELFSSAIGYAAGLASGAELRRELPAVFKQMHGDDVAQFDATSAWHFARANAERLKSGIGILAGARGQGPALRPQPAHGRAADRTGHPARVPRPARYRARHRSGLPRCRRRRLRLARQAVRPEAAEGRDEEVVTAGRLARPGN